MGSFMLQLPNNLRLRNFTVSSSSNGPTPGVPQSGGPVILELPLDKIRRPLMRTRANDQQKVKELMDSIKEIGLQVPDFKILQFMEKKKPFQRFFKEEEKEMLEHLEENGEKENVYIGRVAFPKKQQIDVLEVDGVYYGFSGCHRYEAHQQLGLPTIRCKVRRGTKETLRHHLR